MDDDGFKKKRQNVIGICIVLILLKYLDVQPPSELNIFNVIIELKNPAQFYFALWVLYFYFCYRFYTEWIDTAEKEYEKYMGEIWEIIRIKTTSQIRTHLTEEGFIISGDLDNELYRYFRKDRRFKEWLVIVVSPVSDHSQRFEKKIFRTPFNKLIWSNYFEHRVKNFFNGRYLSETVLPVTLIFITLLYVGFPILVDYIFLNFIL